MKLRSVLSLSIVALTQAGIATSISAQDWRPADEITHQPAPTVDEQGFNFISGGYCVSEPLSNFPDGVTSLSLHLNFCMPVIKGCDGGNSNPDCPDQVIPNVNRNPGAIIHNSINATGWGIVSYRVGTGKVQHSISMPTASGISGYQSGFLYNTNGTRIRENFGVPFVSTLQDSQQNSLGEIDAAGSLMTSQHPSKGRIVTTVLPDGEILRSYLERGSRYSNGMSYFNYRLRYVHSSRGYAQHLKYRTNNQSDENWLSPSHIWQYRTSESFCQPNNFSDCIILQNYASPLVTFNYNYNGLEVTVESSFRGRRKLTFAAGPGGGFWPDYKLYRDLVLVRDENLDIAGSAKTIQYGNPHVSVSGCDRCDDVGAQPYFASRITTPDGVWIYDFKTEVSPWLEDPSETTRTDPLGNVTRIEAAKGLGTVYWIKDAANVESRLQLGSYFRPTTQSTTKSGAVIAPTIKLERDFRGNITKHQTIEVGGTEVTALTTRQQFPADCSSYRTCNRPTRVTDARGAATDFTYDNAHGGLLTAMGPSPVANGARPLLLTEWGKRHSWELGSSGTLVKNPDPIWVKIREKSCQTLSGTNPAAACDPNAPILVTSYEYGPDGTRESLFVKGIAVAADGETLRRCFTHDALGRILSESSPRANLATCQ